ncbi:hypothetical protein HSACCH_01382 [Halanaerobium saccharolyticum subsp. saccharolyticum DSM 6643]|uniref:Uncharacterized protein n=1 Tax=Halanaerobium saccharolyticum subsp. saccharolyticum DSM 6643 TaxID=1293054 RepID=M5E1T2_9FIRM|nr:hypothetical protein HSACCH_01382 [Halanaerobium saccharolyticum subsp. saccharolyticum DSM 6643]
MQKRSVTFEFIQNQDFKLKVKGFSAEVVFLLVQKYHWGCI